MQSITSKDPRKALVVAAIKRATGATAVTMLQHDRKTDTYVAHAFVKRDGGQNFGFVAMRDGEIIVSGEECGKYALASARVVYNAEGR